MNEFEEMQQEDAASKSRRTVDRMHWAAKIGISFKALRDPEFKKLYPFESRLHSIGRYSYHFLDEGEGEAVVMLHGNPTWSFFYREMIRDLMDSYRCLAPDHMGMGFSDKPQKYGYNLARHIANLENWLEAILPPPNWNGGKINLMVHDWGGPIGFGYAIRHPERIKRLIVFNSSIFTDGNIPARIARCRWPIIGEYMVRRMNLFARKATVSTTVDPMPYGIRRGYLMPYNSWKNRVGINAFVRDIPLDGESESRRLFARISARSIDVFSETPLLVQWGMADWCFTPFFLDLWKKNFKSVKIDQYKAGHYLLDDAGDKIIPRVRRFLEGDRLPGHSL